MKRSQVLDMCRYAGYHDDTGSLTKIIINNRISYAKAQDAFSSGKKTTVNGLKCTCRECQLKEAS